MASLAQKVQNGASSIKKVVFASAAGTVIEWYDFYIFGSLGVILAPKFYESETALGSIIAWLGTFAVGFIVRPFGALVFGRIGDLIGRKFTFIVTMSIMGLATFAVGLLPTKEVLGPWAGIILITLRILQGLALGGEYGGAATYIAEHSPNRRRGFFTSWIQTTASLGLFVSLGVILITRTATGAEAFTEWGWRIPFLISILLVGISLWIRMSLKESPMFQKLKASKSLSKNPLKESFVNPVNRKWVIIALLGATMGQGVVWYTGQFYALYYMQEIFKIDMVDTNYIMGAALLIGTPLFIFFGWLSDKIGRKKIMMTGMLLAALTYYPIYGAMAAFAPVDTGQAFLFGYIGYSPVAITALILIQIVYVTMVYGPIAAFLVELFPTKIRYTSMSLPYHIGNGVFGGLVPMIGMIMIQQTGNNFAGLWYPIAIALICFTVGMVFIKETKDKNIDDDSEYEEALRGTGAAKDGKYKGALGEADSA